MSLGVVVFWSSKQYSSNKIINYRWSITCIDELQEYMKQIYQELLDVYLEMEEIMGKEGKAHHVSYAKEAMKELVRSYMTETNWAHKGIVPTTEEHIAVSYISSGYGMLIATCFVGMGDMVTDESFKWALSKPPIVKASCVMARLMNDFYSQKEEKDRMHVASNVVSYMKQYDVTKEHAHNVYTDKIEDLWNHINHEFIMNRKIPLPLIYCSINLTRSLAVIYERNDGFTQVTEEIVGHIKSFLKSFMQCRA
ncbi:putative (-)-beta-caryophyllene synthase [Helianthus anomalus]